MMASDNIISVSELDFEYEVIAYSKQTPVVVDFWAEWCGPCKMLGPILEKLAEEANGAFRLAKVNVDESPNLALRYSIRSIPAVKAFRDGEVVSEFMGAQPEPRVREFVRALAPSQKDLLFEKAEGLLDMEEWAEAETAFRQFLVKSPEHPGATLGLIRALIPQGKLRESDHLLYNFPPSKEYNQAEKIMRLVKSVFWAKDYDGFSDDPLEAAYLNALRLVSLGNFPAAMDGLLDILRQDKHYHNDEVRQVLLGIFDVLGDSNPLTRQYRNELAMVLF
jgi:putative thioredoxin